MIFRRLPLPAGIVRTTGAVGILLLVPAVALPARAGTAAGVRVVHSAEARHASGSLCPQAPGGSGILPDGDFSQAYIPGGSGDGGYSKGQTLAPDWTVTRRTINFVGPQFWNMAGLCSVDLDGGNVGAIQSAPFATIPGASYSLTFLLSGNGCCGGGNPPTVKTMKIKIDGQSTILQWDTSNNNDVEHGIWAAESWTFHATGSTAVLQFFSRDKPHKSTRGAVIAGLSINETTP